MTYRALLTEREREVLNGGDVVAENYLNRIQYRVRQKIERLGEDVALLVEHQPELADKLRITIDQSLCDS